LVVNEIPPAPQTNGGRPKAKSTPKGALQWVCGISVSTAATDAIAIGNDAAAATTIGDQRNGVQIAFHGCLLGLVSIGGNGNFLKGLHSTPK
jgi:hypothetical protein